MAKQEKPFSDDQEASRQAKVRFSQERQANEADDVNLRNYLGRVNETPFNETSDQENLTEKKNDKGGEVKKSKLESKKEQSAELKSNIRKNLEKILANLNESEITRGELIKVIESWHKFNKENLGLPVDISDLEELNERLEGYYEQIVEYKLANKEIKTDKIVSSIKSCINRILNKDEDLDVDEDLLLDDSGEDAFAKIPDIPDESSDQESSELLTEDLDEIIKAMESFEKDKVIQNINDILLEIILELNFIESFIFDDNTVINNEIREIITKVINYKNSLLDDNFKNKQREELNEILNNINNHKLALLDLKDKIKNEGKLSNSRKQDILNQIKIILGLKEANDTNELSEKKELENQIRLLNKEIYDLGEKYGWKNNLMLQDQEINQKREEVNVLRKRLSEIINKISPTESKVSVEEEKKEGEVVESESETELPPLESDEKPEPIIDEDTEKISDLESSEIKVGDLVNWVSQGSLMFKEPKKVRTVVEKDGEWFVLVEGESTVIPIEEIELAESFSSEKEKEEDLVDKKEMSDEDLGALINQIEDLLKESPQTEKDDSGEKKETPVSLEELSNNLKEARHLYYVARKNRMNWIKGRGSKEDLAILKTAYEEALGAKIKAEITNKKEALTDQETERLNQINFYLDKLKDENEIIWKEEFTGRDKLRLEKISAWYRKHMSFPRGLILGTALIGVSRAIPGLSLLALSARGIMRGTGSAVAAENIYNFFGRVLDRWSVSGKLYRATRKNTKQLENLLQNYKEDEIKQELIKLNVQAEREGKHLFEVKSDGKKIDKNIMKIVIEALYEKDLANLAEKMIKASKDMEEKLSGINEVVESLNDLNEKRSEEEVYDHSMSFLNDQLKSFRQLEKEEKESDKRRKREMIKWATILGIGVVTAISPLFFGEDKTNSSGGEGSDSVYSNGKMEGEAELLGGAEFSHIKPGPELSFSSEFGGATPVPDVAPSLDIPNISNYNNVLETVEGVGTSGTNSVWGVIDGKVETVVKSLGANLDADNLSEGKLTYIIDKIKDQIADNPDKFGLGNNIDKVSVTELQNFAENNNLNELITKSFYDQAGGGTAWADTVVEANNLSAEAVSNIEANNSFYESVVSKSPGVKFDQQMYNLMDQAKASGLNPEQTAEMIKTSGAQITEQLASQADVAIPADTMAQTALDATSPEFVTDSISGSLTEQYGHNVADRVMEAVGGEIKAGSAMEKLLNNPTLDFSNLDNQTLAWIKLTKALEVSGQGDSYQALGQIQSVFKESGLVETLGVNSSGQVTIPSLRILSPGKVMCEVLDKVGNPINLLIDTNNSNIIAGKPGVELLARNAFNYTENNPIKVLKMALNGYLS